MTVIDTHLDELEAMFTAEYLRSTPDSVEEQHWTQLLDGLHGCATTGNFEDDWNWSKFLVWLLTAGRQHWDWLKTNAPEISKWCWQHGGEEACKLVLAKVISWLLRGGL